MIELLRFPAIRSFLSHDSPATHVRDLSPSTIEMVREYLDNAVYRIEVHVEEFYHRHMGTWLTIRGCTRSALAVLGVSLACGYNQALRETLLPPRWRAAVSEVYDMLRAWEHESRDVRHLREVVQALFERSDAI